MMGYFCGITKPTLAYLRIRRHEPSHAPYNAPYSKSPTTAYRLGSVSQEEKVMQVCLCVLSSLELGKAGLAPDL